MSTKPYTEDNSSSRLSMDVMPDHEITGDPADSPDDIEFDFVEDDEAPQAQAPSKGQNEDDDGQPAGDDPYDDLASIADPMARDRITEERRLRQEAEERHHQQQDAADKALYNERKRTIQAQEDAFRLSIDGVDVRIRTTREALKMAAQEEDRAAEVELKAQLDELTKFKGQIETNMGKLPSQEQLDQAFQQHMIQRQQQRAQSAEPSSRNEPSPKNQRAATWARNNAWMSNPRNSVEKAAVLAIDADLVREGRNPDSDAYFTELSKRMADKFPTLGVKDSSGRSVGKAPSPAPRQASPPVAGARSSLPPSTTPNNGRAPNGKPRVTLDNSDRAMLRALGIEMSNKEAVKEYVREKYQSQRREAARGRA